MLLLKINVQKKIQADCFGVLTHKVIHFYPGKNAAIVDKDALLKIRIVE